MRDSTPTSPLRLVSLLLPPLVLMAVIFYLSSQPSAAHYPAWEVAVRKLGHAGGYALLAFAWWRAFRELLPSGRRFAAIMGAVVVSLAYAASDELHQSLVITRHGTPSTYWSTPSGSPLPPRWPFGSPARGPTPAPRGLRRPPEAAHAGSSAGC